MFPPTRVDNTICSLVGVSSGTSEWANPATRSHYWRDSYKDLLIETWSSLSLDRKTIALLCVAHRIVTLDDRPCRHSDNNAGTNPDRHWRVESPAGCARDRSSSPLLAVLVPRRFFSSRFLPLGQCRRTGVILDDQVAFSRHNLHCAIDVADLKFRQDTSGRGNYNRADLSRERFRSRYSHAPVLQTDTIALILN